MGVPPEAVTYPRMLPVLVCDTAAGAAVTTKARLRNNRRPSCSNDLRLMNPSPVRVFAFLITRAVGFVKVADGRVDWGRVFPLSLSETDPDAPVQRFSHGVSGRPDPPRRLACVRAAPGRRAEDRLPPRPHDARGETRPAEPALGGQSAERRTAGSRAQGSGRQ